MTKQTKVSLRTALLAGAALLAALAAQAQLTDDVGEGGVLADGSGVYADVGGSGDLEAVKMALPTSAARCWASPSKPLSPITRTRPISPPRSPASGSTPIRST